MQCMSMYVCMYVCMHACMCICILYFILLTIQWGFYNCCFLVRMSVCMYVCTYVRYICTYMYVCTYIDVCMSTENVRTTQQYIHGKGMNLHCMILHSSMQFSVHTCLCMYIHVFSIGQHIYIGTARTGKCGTNMYVSMY